MMRGWANTGSTMIMRSFVTLLVLLGHCLISHMAAAAQSQDCKLCRDDYTACVKAHTQGCLQDQLRHLHEPLSEKIAFDRTGIRQRRFQLCSADLEIACGTAENPIEDVRRVAAMRLRRSRDCTHQHRCNDQRDSSTTSEHHCPTPASLGCTLAVRSLWGPFPTRLAFRVMMRTLKQHV